MGINLLNISLCAQALALISEQCVNTTENSLKNITLVNFLIILILVIVIVANVNEGERAGNPVRVICR